MKANNQKSTENLLTFDLVERNPKNHGSFSPKRATMVFFHGSISGAAGLIFVFFASCSLFRVPRFARKARGLCSAGGVSLSCVGHQTDFVSIVPHIGLIIDSERESSGREIQDQRHGVYVSYLLSSYILCSDLQLDEENLN